MSEVYRRELIQHVVGFQLLNGGQYTLCLPQHFIGDRVALVVLLVRQQSTVKYLGETESEGWLIEPHRGNYIGSNRREFNDSFVISTHLKLNLLLYNPNQNVNIDYVLTKLIILEG